ncbi:sensor histidine kinase [Streptomyces noursei]
MGERSRTRWSPRQADAVLVAVVVALGVVDTWIKPSHGLVTGTPTPIVAVMSGAVGGVLWWRRRRPGLVSAVVMTGYLLLFTPVALGVAMYTVGAAYRRARALVAFGLAGCVVGAATLAADRTPSSVRDYAFTLALIIGPLAVGYTVAVRRDLATAAQERLVIVEREQQLLAERARSEERARIAREMHDVVAHRVTNMVLAAGALQVSGQAVAPRAAQAVERIRADGHQALEELREVLGILAPGRRPALNDLQPDASRLAELVQEVDARGQVSVRLTVEGFPEVLPAPVQRALYRVVQEALTNAAKHAPGSAAEVFVKCAQAGVRITVANGASTLAVAADLPSSGYGLTGLAERVSLVGGSLEAGPRDGGGFLVSAFIPHHRTHPTPEQLGDQ